MLLLRLNILHNRIYDNPRSGVHLIGDPNTPYTHLRNLFLKLTNKLFITFDFTCQWKLRACHLAYLSRSFRREF